MSIQHVNELVERMIGRGYKACSGVEVDPYYELTLWACLMLRLDLAMLLWKYTQDPCRCALVATLLLYRYRRWNSANNLLCLSHFRVQSFKL